MYRNVLVGIDGRDGGRDAVALAQALVADDGRLTLAHVVAEGNGTNAGSIAQADRTRQPDGTPAAFIVCTGSDVGATLEREAAKRGADLIVVGSSHRSVLGRVLAGSGAHDVLHHARRPVAVAPHGLGSAPPAIARIGVAYDGTAPSDAALDHARHLADERHGTVQARDVVSVTVYGYGWALPVDELTEAAREQLTAHLAQAGADEVDLSVVAGAPIDRLEQFSADLDLLVCGTRQLGPLARTARISASDRLADHARCPLLVVPLEAAVTVAGTPVATV